MFKIPLLARLQNSRPFRFVVLLLAALMLWGFVRLREHPGELVTWQVMLAANGFAVAYGYFKNQGGGGLYYFFEFFALAWIFILRAFGRTRRWGGLAQLALVAAVALTLPYKDVRAQRNLIAEIRTQGCIFRDHVAGMTKGEMVFGEETHLETETTASRIMSAPLQELLRSRYKLRAMARHTAPATGASQALFERRF